MGDCFRQFRGFSFGSQELLCASGQRRPGSTPTGSCMDHGQRAESSLLLGTRVATTNEVTRPVPRSHDPRITTSCRWLLRRRGRASREESALVACITQFGSLKSCLISIGRENKAFGSIRVTRQKSHATPNKFDHFTEPSPST